MSRLLSSLLVLVLLAGCSSAYYGAMEKVGFAKRDILVSRVEKARSAQAEAKEEFTDALQAFLAVTRVDGGELKRKYDELNDRYKASESAAKEVRERIDAIEEVAGALFEEWGNELGLYSNPELRARSQEQLAATRTRYTALLATMRRAAAGMDPVLATYRDQVLFLKHNLNAQAVRSLDTTSRTLQQDVSRLIAGMEQSIREADAFIKGLSDRP
ncbi:MAG: DUF2959 domain-containing protein [Opitutaceae bacterium]|nr:DUF2959 domain-containing protein [Opitutaceae bacterium]